MQNNKGMQIKNEKMLHKSLLKSHNNGAESGKEILNVHRNFPDSSF